MSSHFPSFYTYIPSTCLTFLCISSRYRENIKNRIGNSGRGWAFVVFASSLLCPFFSLLYYPIPNDLLMPFSYLFRLFVLIAYTCLPVLFFFFFLSTTFIASFVFLCWVPRIHAIYTAVPCSPSLQSLPCFLLHMLHIPAAEYLLSIYRHYST